MSISHISVKNNGQSQEIQQLVKRKYSNNFVKSFTYS